MQSPNPRVRLALVSRSDPRYTKYRNRHYIENNGCHGQQLHYLVYYDDVQIGIISGASSVYGVKARDEYFGIDSDITLRKAQLCSIVNNVVYRIEEAPRNAATEVLAHWRREIAHDWHYIYGVQVAGFETFVIEDDIEHDRHETPKRTGALYKADNWQMVGLTAGNTKSHRKSDGNGGMNSKHTRQNVCKKLIFVRRVKGMKLATSYNASWKDPDAAKRLMLRRQNLVMHQSGQMTLGI